MYSAVPIPGDRRVYRCTIIAGDTRPRPHPEARYGRDGATIIEPGQGGYMAALQKGRASGRPNGNRMAAEPFSKHAPPPSSHILTCRTTKMIDDEAALLKEVRFALRGLDPWPRKATGFRPKNTRAKFSII